MTSVASPPPPIPASSPAAPSASDAIECEARPVPPRPLHIAFALGGTDLGKSGIGTYVREVLPPLIDQVRREGGTVTAFGHATEIAAYAESLRGAQTWRVRWLPTKPGLNALWHLARSNAFARRIEADVLLLPAANRRIAASATVPTVAVVHDLAQLRVAQKYDALRMCYFRRVLLPAFHRPTRLIAVSAATCADLVQSLGIAPYRVKIVYNGVNTSLFKAVGSSAVTAARARAGLAAKPYLLYPARLEHPGKNHLRLLRAFAQSGLAATHTLALSGADWGAGELIRTTIRELRLETAVAFLGFVPSGELPALVAGADAVLMLGLHEGFGLPALEGLSAGRPVCVSNTGALPEVVGNLGVQCDPLSEDAIHRSLLRVVNDPTLRDRCHREGPTWAEGFTWSHTAQGLLSACHEAAS